MRPHPPLSRKPPGSHAPTTQLSELRASLEADGHLQRKTGSPGSRCRHVRQMAGGETGFGGPWRCDWGAGGVTLAGSKGPVTGMTVGGGAGAGPGGPWGQGGSGQKGELCSPRSPLGHGVGRCCGRASLPSFLSPSLLPSLPSPSLLPSYSPPLLSLSGSPVPPSGCSDSQSSTQLLEGPWGEGVWPAFHLLPHQHLFPQSLAWKHAVPGASFVTNGDKISSLLSPPNKPHQTAQPPSPPVPTHRRLYG